MGIREKADNGSPAACKLLTDPADADAEALAFGALADAVIGAVARRNQDLPPTEAVKMKH